jgi:hypothetical protein
LVVVGIEGRELINLSFVSRNWRRSSCAEQTLARRETVCFHTKLSSTETTLGIGLRIVMHDDGNIKAVEPVLDVLSEVAWNKGIRKGAWGDSFTHWLPLALDARHAQKALPLAEKAIAGVLGATTFEPWMVLAVLPQAMNSFVVSLMESCKDGVRRHASEKALWGYCSLHHLLLALAKKHIRIRQLADRLVSRFLDSEASRTKEECADLGQLLMLLAVAPRSWKELAPSLLQEAFARNVLWIDREKPKPLHAMSAQEWFDATLTSKRLLMFQAFFLRQNVDLATYNLRFGQPTEAQQSELVRTARGILKVTTWNDFYRRVSVVRPESDIAMMLAAVDRSARCGYHGGGKGKGKGKGKGGRIGWIARIKALATASIPMMAAEERLFLQREAAFFKSTPQNPPAKKLAPPAAPKAAAAPWGKKNHWKAEEPAATKLAAPAAPKAAAAPWAKKNPVKAEEPAAKELAPPAAPKAAVAPWAKSTATPLLVPAPEGPPTPSTVPGTPEIAPATPLLVSAPKVPSETVLATPLPVPEPKVPSTPSTVPGTPETVPASPEPEKVTSSTTSTLSADAPVFIPGGSWPHNQQDTAAEEAAAPAAEAPEPPKAEEAEPAAQVSANPVAATAEKVPEVPVEPEVVKEASGKEEPTVIKAQLAPVKKPDVEFKWSSKRVARAQTKEPEVKAVHTKNRFECFEEELPSHEELKKRRRNVMKKLREATALEKKAELTAEEEAKVARVAALEREADELALLLESSE